MKKIVLESADIELFEKKVNELPVFAKNVAENMAVSVAVQSLMQWLGSKIVDDENAQVVE